MPRRGDAGVPRKTLARMVVLTFETVDADVVTALAAAPTLDVNVRSLPYIGRHFARALQRSGVFSTLQLLRAAAAAADPGGQMANSLAGRRRAMTQLQAFLAGLAEAPRGASCVRSRYDAAPAPSYLVRDVNPGAYWALVATLARLWPAGGPAGVAALTAGRARFLRRADVLDLRRAVRRPRAAGARSAAASATCTCRRSQAACAAASLGGSALCQWLAHGSAAQGLPNWQQALAGGVCLPRTTLNLGGAEGLPGRTQAVEPAPYPAAGQQAQAALVGPGGAANATLASYTRRGARQFRAPR